MPYVITYSRSGKVLGIETLSNHGLKQAIGRADDAVARGLAERAVVADGERTVLYRACME